MTPTELREIAHVLANLDKEELETAGLMKPGQVGGNDWRRFNADPLMFILKLSPDGLQNLCKLIEAKMEGTS